jgi:hypothetical protein
MKYDDYQIGIFYRPKLGTVTVDEFAAFTKNLDDKGISFITVTGGIFLWGSEVTEAIFLGQDGALMADLEKGE